MNRTSRTSTDPSGASSTAAVRLKVKPVNDPPEGVTETISAPYRGTITGRLKGYDRESRAVTFKVLEKPSNGQLSLNLETGEYSFSTDGSSSSESALKFVVFDGALSSAPAELIIQIRSM